MIGVHFDPLAAETEINRLLTVFGIGIFLLIGSVLLAFFPGAARGRADEAAC